MNQVKINRIARNLGSKLCQIGIKILKSAFRLEPKMLTAHEIELLVKSKVKLNNLTLADGKYYLISWDTWKQIIETDWTDKMKYLKDVYDCDNFTYSFASRMSEIFNINTAGIVHGHLYNKDTGKWIGGHFWNAILTKEDLYFYEPMKDTYVKAGNKVVMGNWEYRCLSARFF